MCSASMILSLKCFDMSIDGLEKPHSAARWSLWLEMPCTTFGGAFSYFLCLPADQSACQWCSGRHYLWFQRVGESQDLGKWTTTLLLTITKQGYSCQTAWQGPFSRSWKLQMQLLVMLNTLATAIILIPAGIWRHLSGSILTHSIPQWNLRSGWNLEGRSCWWLVSWEIPWKWWHRPTATTTMVKRWATNSFPWKKSCRWD